MNPSVPDFPDDSKDRYLDLSSMSDADLARLLEGGGATPSAGKASFEEMEPGTKVRGTVMEIQRDGILVELDRKTLGVIDPVEFGEAPLPVPGTTIQAEFLRYDRRKEVCVLTIGGVRTEVAWDDLRPGHQVEGKVVEALKGGLILDVKGLRAFMPISQIALERLEVLDPYMGQKMTCEVQEVDRAGHRLVVSRRVILERDRESRRKTAFSSLQEGTVMTGRIVRLTEHGAFVNLGAMDGLIHASKLRQSGICAGSTGGLTVGQNVEVRVVQVDQARGRVGLDFHRVAGESWETTAAGYKVGDEVTGWISKVGPEGAILKIDEGVEAVIPLDPSSGSAADLRPGVILKASITGIDAVRRRLTARPRG